MAELLQKEQKWHLDVDKVTKQGLFITWKKYK